MDRLYIRHGYIFTKQLANISLHSLALGLRQRLFQRLNYGFNIPSLRVDNRDAHMTGRLKVQEIHDKEQIRLTLCGSICLRKTG